MNPSQPSGASDPSGAPGVSDTRSGSDARGLSDTMDLSFGEFEALVAKAFRGVGYPWGLTEEAAFAARRLAEARFPVAPMVERLLEQVDGLPVGTVMPDTGWESQGRFLCPVCVGVCLADQAGVSDLRIGPTMEPALLAPFLESTVVAEPGREYLVGWDGGGCRISGRGLERFGLQPSGPVALTVSATTSYSSANSNTRPNSSRTNSSHVAAPPGDVWGSTPPSPTRVMVDRATIAGLDRFASRTYAPATDASRTAGAGADRIDDE